MQSPSPRTPQSTRSRLTLTRRLLLFQLSLLAIVLVAVTAISLEQTRQTFESGQQRRMLAVAEYSAANPLLRSILADAAPDVSADASSVAPADASPDADAPAASPPARLTAPVETLRTTTGVDELIVTDAAGRVLASPADPRLLRTVLVLGTAPTGSDGAWAGLAPLGTIDHVVARVPVLDDAGELVGHLVAGRQLPTLAGLLAAAAPNLLTYLSVAGVLGAAGSWWMAARVKRQTLGLEPEQIARLVEHREAMLHGIREGVVAVDADGIITLANDSARMLLGLPDDAPGRSIHEVGLDDAAARALRTHGENDRDTPLVNGGMLLVLNQTTIHPPRAKPEVVTTLRDRTELVTLQRDLGSSQQATDTLRAQTHEFANRLHTISMLMQLGDTDAAVDYIDAVTRDRSDLDRDVLTRLAEPAVAALVIAKTSLARERGAELTLSAASALPRVDPRLSTDLVTVIGNLVDNALDAVTGAGTRKVEVDIRMLAAAVRVTVRDTGPGVESGLLERVFEAGVTSKRPAPARSVAEIGAGAGTGAESSGAEHGFGLAIVRLVVTRRGGEVTYRHEDGTVFTAVLPVSSALPVLSVEPGRPAAAREANHV
ncbi:GHKL domain-containing protein [Cryobacterium sp. TMT2-10]|uniref:histidine kinase n=1 Tax=Cryobacterium shii TaxID=1259235 RepID=A0AAQ2C6V0_9MICO|nr:MULTISPECIES: ATP-binding protein [Cryobacterium]TFC49261.1 GHKL domain-containing protein [Cryobacterium shii]TFC83486.1 GHKL domain-containing protein [Cryobacterium sp. TmT2-59]TFD16104.1 GHKL domain-containing protein [Cryobacterium sp. TMT2-23]TFD16178.1 GHKL domain-containing protein [Cryobacterium sp. TMT4-10]TFD37277.1 GHKL domain-containing protein [Cryobacterium sp. TMT2-10]